MNGYEYERIRADKFRHVRVFVNDISYRNYHYHEAFELMLVLGGGGRVRLTGETLTVKPGSLIVINPYLAHEITAENEHLLTAILQVSGRFAQEYLTELAAVRFLNPDLSALSCAGKLADILLDCTLLELNTPEYFRYSFLSLISELFYLMMSEVPHETLSSHDHSALRKRTQRLNRILSYLDRNFAEPIRLSELAEMEQLTPTYISHLISSQLGVTFQEYLSNLRFERAAYLLAGQHILVSDAAALCGFSDPKYLNRMMKERFGVSASEFRSHASPSVGFWYADADSYAPLERYLPEEEALAAVTDYRAKHACHG